MSAMVLAWAALISGAGGDIRDIPLIDPSGRIVRLRDHDGAAATVIVFLSADCPMSNAYVPKLNELHAAAARKQVRFVGVHVGAVDPAAVGAHAREHALAFPALVDPRGALAAAAGAEVTPEVVVLDKAGAVVYRGRIDDRWSARLQRRERIDNDDLRDALDAVLAGKPVKAARTEAFGCRIGKAPAKTAAADAPTFHRDVEPLLQKHCQSCHRAGQVGPFALTTYDESAKWADDIKDFVARRAMPPWKPSKVGRPLDGDRSLSDAEIATFVRWVDGGSPRGDPKHAPAAAKFADDWALGAADLVLTPDEAYRLAADGKDDFRCFVFPTNFAKEMYVAAIEIKPGNAKVVHHALLFVDGSGAARRLDAQQPGPGYTPAGLGVGFFPISGLGGWAPGNVPHRLPDGLGRPLPKGGDIVVQVHYHKSGKAETDRTRVGIWFAKGEVKDVAKTVPVASRGIRIPAGEAQHRVTASYTVPHDITAIGATPHMHLLGKSMRMTARLPDGTLHELISIPDWDFNWQDSYRFREPLALPKGTKVTVEALYDNSAGNPRNPSSPPKLVTWGEQTTNEMCIGFLHVSVPVNDTRQLLPIPIWLKPLLPKGARL